MVYRVFLENKFAAKSANDVQLLGEVVASSLVGRIPSGESRKQGELLDSLRSDSRVGFACLIDPSGKILHASVFRNNEWDQFTQSQQPFLNQRKINPNLAVSSSLSDGLFVFRYPIQKRTSEGVSAQLNQEGAIEGSVILGYHDRKSSSAIETYQFIASLTAIGFGLLSLPLIYLLVRRWTRPLKELLNAIRQLETGNPKPARVGGRNEFSFLATRFNNMAGKLIKQHHELIDANERLDQRVRDRTIELEEAMQKLDEMASTDVLTGLANRRAFNEALERHYAAAIRYEEDLGCLMVDLDGFKNVNDTLGHDAGDEILVIAAEALQENIRDSDYAARLGGDEFVVLMPKIDFDSTEEIVDRILNCLMAKTTKFLENKGIPAKVGMSLGLASLVSHGAKTGEQLLNQADSALYIAKANGKGYLEIFDKNLVV